MTGSRQENVSDSNNGTHGGGAVPAGEEPLSQTDDSPGEATAPLSFSCRLACPSQAAEARGRDFSRSPCFSMIALIH